MDEYKPINVHDILLTAVHDGGRPTVQVKNSTFQMNHFYCLPNSNSRNSVTLKNWTAVAHSQVRNNTGPAMIIRSLIRIRQLQIQ